MISFTSIVVSQLSLALLVLFVILFQKQLGERTRYLISRILHVRQVHADILSEKVAHGSRYIFVIDIRSSIMKTRRRYRQANINGPMGKAT